MKKSAGLLLFRKANGQPEFLLVHPGGPFWKNKDEGAWSIPKGEYEEHEEPLEAAKREFKEETGYSIEGDFIQLNAIRLKSGKQVRAWAIEKDIAAENIRSNTFSLEWPPRSGKKIEVPEVDKAQWCDINEARKKINTAQISFIDQLVELLDKGLR